LICSSDYTIIGNINSKKGYKMKLSKLFIKNTKDVPAEVKSPSHKLLLKGSYIRKISPGLYSYLPAGCLILKKIRAILERELEKSGFQEIIMPLLLPQELIESGFSDTMALLERLGGPSLGELGEQDCGFNNAGKMQKVTVPTIILHGEGDYIIPIEEGKRLFQECDAKDKRFVGIPRAGHNDLLLRGRREYFEAVRSLVFG